jgi:type IV pilus assembly protein PilM
MFRVTRAQVLPIGVDIGHDTVKMLQLEVVGDSLCVTAAAKSPLPAEVRSKPALRMEMASGVIRQMLRQHPFRGRNVVAALPRDIVHSKNLRLPPMPDPELDAVVHFEAKNVFPFDTDQAAVHYLPAGEVRQGNEIRKEVVLLAARNEDVDQFVEHLHQAGCVIQSLDVEPCALYRGVERFIRRREDENDVHVLVDVGSRRSQIVIGRGREITFIKPIDIGGHQFHDAVARKLGITLEEAEALRKRLVDAAEPVDPSARKDPVRQAVFDAARGPMEELGREIALCLRYYSVTFRGQRPTRVRLVGGEAWDPQLQTLLNAALVIPVEVGKPLYSVNTSKMRPTDRRGSMCEWALALGLGLKTTDKRFGARDGKPRDSAAPDTQQTASGAATEVIDFNKALRDADPAPPIASAPAARNPPNRAGRTENSNA